MPSFELNSLNIEFLKALLKDNSILRYVSVFVLALIGLVLLVRIFRCIFNGKRSSAQSVGLGSEESDDWDWFGPNKAKEQYEAYLVNSPDNTVELKKLLRERAFEIIKRLRKLEEEKEALGKLYKNGSISQTMWESLKDAEKETQLEVFEIQAEADTFEKGWGENILRDASASMQESDNVTAILKELKKSDPSIKIPDSEEGKKMLAKRIMHELKRKGSNR